LIDCYCVTVDQVTDFGLSIEKDGVGTDGLMDDYCGTPLYMCAYSPSSQQLLW